MRGRLGAEDEGVRIPILMPQLGYEMPTGRIAGWTKRVGDDVSKGDIIAEVETEKTTVGMEALDAGMLVEIVHDTGAEVPVGEVIGWLEDGKPGVA
jgi:pyruvate/2-oxoglutarate dehydrogenase complex dihydrolipoamide acyltransferase (E2) component